MARSGDYARGQTRCWSVGIIIVGELHGWKRSKRLLVRFVEIIARDGFLIYLHYQIVTVAALLSSTPSLAL